VHVKLPIKPGDVLSAAVDLTGDSAFFHLRDQTSGRSFGKRHRVRSPDTSSAEWITEAPLECYGSTCTPEPLTDFGTVTFSAAVAVAANGHIGGIANPAWTTIESEIEGDTEGITPTGEPLSVDATPALSSSGTSFTVTWQVIAGSPPAP
jgi:hypothetical protein